MKVWKIYSISINPNTNEKRYDLCAVTNKEEFITAFKSIRNMKKYIIKKDSWSKEEYASFMNNNMDYLLSYMPVKTADIKKGIYTTKDVEVLMTNFEFDGLVPEGISFPFEDEDWWGTIAYDVIKMKKPIINALKELFFFDHQKIFDPSHKINIIEDDYSYPDYVLDQLSFYVVTNKNLLKQ